MQWKIAIVNSSSFGRRFPDHLERLEKIGPVDRIRVAGDCHGAELAETLAPYNLVISSVTPFFDEEFFAHKRDLAAIVRHGIGYNNVDVPAATAAGTLLTIVSPLVERDAVAEGSVALLMDVMRHVSDSREAGNAGRWADRASFVGAGLSGKTLGIIGCGNIGSRVAEILGRGFGMEVIASDPVHRDEWAAAEGVSYVELDELLERADAISLNASLNETSLHILNADSLAKAARTPYIVNCARADLVDQPAMIAALDSGRVAGYACDVMHDEPPAPDDPYFNHANVVVTTHISAYTLECLRGMGEKCVADVERFVAGEPAVNSVNGAELGLA